MIRAASSPTIPCGEGASSSPKGRIPAKSVHPKPQKAFDIDKNSVRTLSTFYGTWTTREQPAMKGQDILLMYKMASLHAQEEMSPTGNPTVAWGGLSSIDLLPDDYTQEFQFITSASPEKSWDNLEVAIKGLIDADSFPWEGWDANDLSQKSPATK
jgi:hypothetical protein